MPLEKLYPLHQTGNSLILEDIEKENNNNNKPQDVLKCPLATFLSLMVLRWSFLWLRIKFVCVNKCHIVSLFLWQRWIIHYECYHCFFIVVSMFLSKIWLFYHINNVYFVFFWEVGIESISLYFLYYFKKWTMQNRSGSVAWSSTLKVGLVNLFHMLG